ncbi:flap endonuclease 1-like [Rhopalosiphum maidis]|uniref:flap endonuclease 1-like n=1 Tax=Rhopalosiphum maidis TaxID=43146 RepID=UPI000EFEED49|nr:flap endonuclease 1-like [Rhopalosiphum maidis]
MTKRTQENLNEKLLKKRKKPHKNYGKIKIKYNAMHEHNYFHVDKIKNCRWSKKVNHTEKITNDYDECDSTLDWYRDLSSSDEEEDIKDMSLSHLLKIELEKDLLKECKNKKSSKNQLYDELNNKNNHNLLNISNDSNSVISENHLINNGEQSTFVQIVPLTNDALIIQNQNITNESQTIFGQSCKELTNNNCTFIGLLPNVSMNEEARTDHYNNNMQNYFLSFSLDTNNPILERETQSSYNHVNVAKTSANNVCPPLHWILLIYLAIKNSATENVSCYDIQRFVRYWFPYYNKESYIGFIRIILNHINNFGEKYFYCNSFPIDIDENDTWTINSFYIKLLEKRLIRMVKNNENKIKSAMTNPDKLSTIVNGYGVSYLGFSQNL